MCGVIDVLVAVFRCLWTSIDLSECLTYIFTLDRSFVCYPQEKGGHTPLHMAAAQGHVGLLRLLVEKGADLNMKQKVRICEGMP